jgi:small GTP-binding protein
VTLGVDFYEAEFKKDVKGNDDVIFAQIWDLASQKTFVRIRAQYLSYSHFIIIVIDINRTTDDFIQQWIGDLKAHAGEDVPYVFALNKIDLATDQIISEEKERLENQYKVKVFPTSAKSGHNIKEIFEHIGTYLWDKI